MGICASSPTQSMKTSSRLEKIRSGPSNSISDRIKLLSNVVKVVNASDGGLQEYKTPVKARQVTSKNTNTGCFLGSSENILVGTCVPRVPDDEDLNPTHIYFLLPEAHAHRPISLPDLCSLAIKASSSTVDFSSYNRKLTGFR